MMQLSLKFSLPFFIVCVFAPCLLAGQSSTSVGQSSPEQYLRSLFYRGDSAFFERDSEALVTVEGASLESRAWFVSQAEYGKTFFRALSLLDGMMKQSPQNPWTLAAQTFFTSDIEYAVSLCEKATAHDAREDILLLCATGAGGQVKTSEDGAIFKEFLERHQEKFEASAQALAVEGNALRDMHHALEHKEYSDDASALYDRALKMDPLNIVALGGKVRDLCARKQYKEATQLVEHSPSPLISESLHIEYFYWAVPNLEELGKEEKALRIEVDGRKMLEYGEPSDSYAHFFVSKLGEFSKPQADAIVDLILQRYPNSKAGEWARMNRALGNLDPEHVESAPPETRKQVAAQLVAYLNRTTSRGETAESTAVWTLAEIAHYGDASTEQLFQVANSISRENALPLVQSLADHKAHLPELELIASAQTENLLREAEQNSLVWHSDLPEWKAFNLKRFWEGVANWEDALGWVYLQQGRVNDAEQKLITAEKLLDMDVGQGPGKFLDGSMDLLTHLGRLYTAKGDYSKAEDYLGRAMSVEYDYADEHPATAAYKELYLRQHGSSEGLDKYMAVAYDKERTRRKNLVLKERIADARPIPPFKLTTIDGKTVSSDELKGKVAVINFWGVWCGPCLYELPEIQSFYEKYKDNPNVVFLTIDSGDGQAQVKTFMKGKKYTFPILMEGNYVSTARIQGFPTTWFVDRNGKKVFERSGGTKRVVEEFSWLVEALTESQSESTGRGAAAKPR
jgi:thiol-disulfide isomerase/thioredoxin